MLLSSHAIIAAGMIVLAWKGVIVYRMPCPKHHMSCCRFTISDADPLWIDGKPPQYMDLAKGLRKTSAAATAAAAVQGLPLLYKTAKHAQSSSRKRKAYLQEE